jgi:diguanylate cyclase (GGDEF)-like protein
VEAHLFEWSNAAQISSAFIIAVFFGALARSVGRVELRWWMRAWIANVLALAVSTGFWAFTVAGYSAPAWGKLLTRICYMAPKSAFVMLLIYGAWLLRPRPLPWLTPRTIAALVAGFAIVAGSLLPGVDLTGVAETTVITLAFGVAAAALVRSGDATLRWLAVGFGARAALALVEGVTYVIDYAPAHAWPAFLRTHSATILAGHSSFDTGAEWLIALGCVLAVSNRTQRELQHANATLLDAQEELRRLADRDPLTALANRRSLPQVFRAVHDTGAALVFFDLDGFKQINDAHGHQAGDVALKTFADALVESFRPSDAVVRYGGDEFVVVATGLDAASATERALALRTRLQRLDRPVAIEFSFGVTVLAPGVHPDEALRAADEAMYERKRQAVI